jgi:putative transposase
VLWPRADDEVGEFTKWMTLTHTQRWHAHYHTSGSGRYQGRYKSSPVQQDMHLLLVWRYVERNALRANLVSRAQDWRWGSLWRRHQQRGAELLSDGPLARPADWLDFVNEPQSEEELAALRGSVDRGRPFGDDDWQRQTVTDLGLEATLRPRGRPPKMSEAII